jgi:hypothetical protein
MMRNAHHITQALEAQRARLRAARQAGTPDVSSGGTLDTVAVLRDSLKR